MEKNRNTIGNRPGLRLGIGPHCGFFFSGGNALILKIRALGFLMIFLCITGCSVCGEGPEVKKIDSAVGLRLVTGADSISIFYQRSFSYPEEIRILEKEVEGLRDTIQLKFLGQETFVEERAVHFVEINGIHVLVKHETGDSDSIRYAPAENKVEVLSKTSCPPIYPGLRVDSILIEHSSRVRVGFRAR